MFSPLVLVFSVISNQMAATWTSAGVGGDFVCLRRVH